MCICLVIHCWKPRWQYPLLPTLWDAGGRAVRGEAPNTFFSDNSLYSVVLSENEVVFWATVTKSGLSFLWPEGSWYHFTFLKSNIKSVPRYPISLPNWWLFQQFLWACLCGWIFLRLWATYFKFGKMAISLQSRLPCLLYAFYLS